MSKHDEDILRKFKVERLAPSSRGIDHTDCRYFVLDISHDPHARNAALAYADSCQSEYPNLAYDLRSIVAGARDWEFDRPSESVPATATPSDQDPSQKEEGPHA